MRKLALDLGTKTCGFAISDEMGIIATGLENFQYQNDDLLQVVARTIHWLNEYQNKVDTIVLGYPTNAYDGSMNARSYLVLDFKAMLEKALPNQKIVLYDERFTTRIATTYLMQSDVKAAKRKKVKDKMSAVVILSDYLNSLQYQR